jgi:hypothetical protein
MGALTEAEHSVDREKQKCIVDTQELGRASTTLDRLRLVMADLRAKHRTAEAQLEQSQELFGLHSSRPPKVEIIGAAAPVAGKEKGSSKPHPGP